MDEQPLISVVMLTWNRKEDTIENLTALRGQTYRNFEIVVVDNNSTDSVDKVIESDFPEVRLIRMPRNFGVALGRNIGIKNAKGRYIFLLDNDGILDNNALAVCAEAFRREDRLAVLTGKVINFHLKRMSDSDWVHPVDKAAWADREFDSPVFAGGCCCLSREVLDQVGLFPEDFFRQDEEIDLCYRVLDAGFRIKYTPGIVFHHKQSPTQRSLPFQYYNTTKNNLSVVWRYLPLPLAIKQTGIRLYVLAVRGAQKGFLFAYLKGCWGFLIAFPGILASRKSISSETVEIVGRLWGQSGKPIHRLLW